MPEEDIWKQTNPDHIFFNYDKYQAVQISTYVKKSMSIFAVSPMQLINPQTWVFLLHDIMLKKQSPSQLHPTN